MTKPNAFVIYDGASQIDGQRIIAIANIAKSRNGKTGAMVQTYILRLISIRSKLTKPARITLFAAIARTVAMPPMTRTAKQRKIVLAM